MYCDQCSSHPEPGAGSTLISSGDQVSGIYFVEAGAVRVHYLDAEGHEGTLYRLAPGDCCILVPNCLFADMRYPAWANAEEQGASLLVLDGAAARELAQLDAAFLQAMFARLLLDLAGESPEVRPPHERLAGHLGTSREVVSRLLRGFVRDGLVNSGYGRIAIADRPMLEQRCH